MKRSDVTYKEFDQVLVELGFERFRTKDGFRLYRHDPTETVVLLPGEPDDEYVPVYHVRGNAFILDGRGVVERDEFERMIAERKVA